MAARLPERLLIWDTRELDYIVYFSERVNESKNYSTTSVRRPSGITSSSRDEISNYTGIVDVYDVRSRTYVLRKTFKPPPLENYYDHSPTTGCEVQVSRWLLENFDLQLHLTKND